jgi:urease accessory protein
VNGRLEATVTGGRVTYLATRPPLSAKVLAGPTLLLIGSAAGLLEGDQSEVRLRLGAGSQLTVRSGAATMAHACPDGGRTSLDVAVDAGRGARLAWMPEPLLAHAACRHRSTAHLTLAAGAVAVWAEATALGRSGETAGDVELRLDVELEGRPLLRDALRTGPSAQGAAGPAVLAGARHVGTVALLGARPSVDANLVMALAGPGAVARALAFDAATLERRLAPIRRSFLDHLSPPEESSHVA